jgi:predicted nucleotidyltransferase
MFPDSPDLSEVRRIVLRGLAGRRAHVYLFGSWARGDASRVSDIDVAILPAESLPPDLLPEIEEALDASLSLYPVDLVDLTAASDAFRARVLAEGLLWTDEPKGWTSPSAPSGPFGKHCENRKPR